MSCWCFRKKLSESWAQDAQETARAGKPEELRNLGGTNVPPDEASTAEAPGEPASSVPGTTATTVHVRSSEGESVPLSAAAKARPPFEGFEDLVIGTVETADGDEDLVNAHSAKFTSSAIQHRGTHRDDSSRFARFAPSRVVDGRADTCWAGGRDHNQECWLQVETESTVVVTAVAVMVRHTESLILQVSRGGTWATVASLDASPGAAAGGAEVSLRARCFSGPGTIFRIVQAKDAALGADKGGADVGDLNCGMEVVALSLKGFRARPPALVAGQRGATDPPAVFMSYNWEHQRTVTRTAFQVERALGVRVWQDIGQLGGGDSLLHKIYEGMKGARVVVACMSRKYAASLNCRREMFLAASFGIPVVLVRVDPGAAHLPAEDAFLGALFRAHPPALDLSAGEPAAVIEGVGALVRALHAVLATPATATATAPAGSAVARPLADPPGGLAEGTPAEVWLDVEAMAASTTRGLPAVIPVPHEAAPRARRPSEAGRVDLALGRPCFGSGNFYGQPEEWVGLHASCATLPGGRDSGRFSGARDGAGDCWIVVDLGCLARVDEVVVDFEVAAATRFRVDYEVPGSLCMGADGALASSWKEVGVFHGGEGEHSTGVLPQPVETRAIRIFLITPFFAGGGFSCWSLRVFGTSEEAPVHDYFLAAAREDLAKWQRVKLVDDVASERRKAVFVHAGAEGVPTPALPPSPPEQRDAALAEAEAVLVFVSRHTAAAGHIAADVEAAQRLGKPLIPILWDSVDEAGEPLPWPPADPVLAAAFADLIYIDFRSQDEYSRSHALLVRVLAGTSSAPA